MNCVVCGKQIEDHGRKYCKACRKEAYRLKQHECEQRNNKPPKAGYEALVAHIIKQARKDYFHKSHGRFPYRKDCIRFFKSEWFYFISGLDGRAMLEELERIAE